MNTIQLSRLSPIDRFRRLVAVGNRDECWEWLGNRDPKGYGRVRIKGALLSAHRLSYELHVGPIPAGLQIDHLCRNKSCVNPKHLEPVTFVENVRRGIRDAAPKTHCLRGHLLTPSNTRIQERFLPDGRVWICRNCIQCVREKHARPQKAAA